MQECEEVPRLGTAMPVVTYGLGKLSNVVPLPEAGQWVKLRNVAACLINGQLQVRIFDARQALRCSLCFSASQFSFRDPRAPHFWSEEKHMITLL